MNTKGKKCIYYGMVSIYSILRISWRFLVIYFIYDQIHDFHFTNTTATTTKTTTITSSSLLLKQQLYTTSTLFLLALIMIMESSIIILALYYNKINRFFNYIILLIVSISIMLYNIIIITDYPVFVIIETIFAFNTIIILSANYLHFIAQYRIRGTSLQSN